MNIQQNRRSLRGHISGGESGAGLSALLSSEYSLVKAVFLGSALVSLAFLVYLAWPDPDYDAVDFKYFWLAGTLWLEGVSPYGAEFKALGQAVYPGDHINDFFYPPNFRPLASAIALFDHERAENIWAALSVAAITMAAWQLALLSKKFAWALSPQRMFCLFILLIALGAHSGAIAVYIGQASPFLLLALTSLLLAGSRGAVVIATIALSVLLLKPNLSFPIIAAAVFMPNLRIAAFIACVVTGGLALFGLGLASTIENLTQYLANISSYNLLPENLPIHMSGPSFVYALFGFAAPSPLLLIILAAAIAGAMAHWRSRTKEIQLTPCDQITLILFAVITALAVMPTHNLDFLLATPIVLLIVRASGAVLVTMISGLFLIARSYSLSTIPREAVFGEPTVWVGLFDSIGAFLLFGAVAFLLLFDLTRTEGCREKSRST